MRGQVFTPCHKQHEDATKPYAKIVIDGHLNHCWEWDDLAKAIGSERWRVKEIKRACTIGACGRKCIHTSLNSSLCATASKHSWPVLSTDSVNSTNSPLSSWIRVTRQLLLETVYLRVLLSFKPNGRGIFLTSPRGRSSLMHERWFSWMAS